jgi:hypothetical protein
LEIHRDTERSTELVVTSITLANAGGAVVYLVADTKGSETLGETLDDRDE